MLATCVGDRTSNGPLVQLDDFQWCRPRRHFILIRVSSFVFVNHLDEIFESLVNWLSVGRVYKHVEPAFREHQHHLPHIPFPLYKLRLQLSQFTNQKSPPPPFHKPACPLRASPPMPSSLTWCVSLPSMLLLLATACPGRFANSFSVLTFLGWYTHRLHRRCRSSLGQSCEGYWARPALCHRSHPRQARCRQSRPVQA